MSKVVDFFKIGRGISGLTEEFIYNNYGKVPVISATSDKFYVFGSVDSEAVKSNTITYPVIIIIRVGKAGLTQTVDFSEFTVTENVLYLYPKDEYKNDFNLKWVENNIRPLLLRNVRGDINGQRNISAEIIYRLEINNVDIKIQENICNLLNQTEKIYKEIVNTLTSINSLSLSEFKNVKGSMEEISKIFHIKGGNSGLSQEFIYYNQPVNEEEKIPAYSGATLQSNSLGYISKYAKLNGKTIKTFIGPCIIVTRNGVYAGTMTNVEEGQFTINDHAYVFELKKVFKNIINLRWFVYQYQELFYNLVSSKSDNATFNKTQTKAQLVKIPKKNFQDNIANKLLHIDKLTNKLEGIKIKLENLLQCKVLYK